MQLWSYIRLDLLNRISYVTFDHTLYSIKYGYRSINSQSIPAEWRIYQGFIHHRQESY